MVAVSEQIPLGAQHRGHFLLVEQVDAHSTRLEEHCLRWQLIGTNALRGAT